MIKEVYKNIYQIPIILPNNPLKQLNSYLIKGDKKSLLIDTGFNREECRKDLLNSLETLNIDLEKLDIFITHLHADHSGQVAEFKETSDNIYASKVDGEFINDMTRLGHWEELEEHVKLSGLEEDNVRYMDHPAYKYKLSEKVNFKYIEGGDTIEIGDYSFEVIETPGHTPGQVGLYEPKYKLYFSGDHILDQITPNVAFWGFEYEDLKTYLRNLEKVAKMDIDLIFPAHRNIMDDHPRRAKEIIEHHKERIEEVYNILNDDFMTVRDVTSRMTWRIRANSWSDFPKAQKWFASGEALAHLEFLYHDKKVIRKKKNGVLYYKKLK